MGRLMTARAVTFDFYNTLVYHRAGIGRGRQYLDYLSSVGLAADPWEHQVLYDVFAYYGSSYTPALSDEAKRSFWIEFTRRLFERTKVRAAGVINYAEHAQPIQDIMGPNCFALYEESLQVLRGLRDAGFRLGVISDWQEGLGVFCQELGLGAYLDVVVASSEVGYQKPDPRLFEVASKRMKIPAFQILHVGDTMPDVEGARAAGFSAVLLLRDGDPTAGNVPVIRSLDEVFSCLKAPPN